MSVSGTWHLIDCLACQVLYEDRCEKRKEKAAMLRKIFENLAP